MAVSCKLSKYSIHPSDESDGFFGQGLFNNINHSLNVIARFVKVTALSEDKIPAWHGGKEHPAFLFVDEISVD